MDTAVTIVKSLLAASAIVCTLIVLFGLALYLGKDKQLKNKTKEDL